MASWIHTFMIVHLLLIQGHMNENRYCKEAVQSVKTVSSCPTSKDQWDKAAIRMKCTEKALKQNCTTPEKFVYHCVINGYGNATLEVCAPQRLILGHCAEFNEVGGVIQDQRHSLCNDVFPRCDIYYLSSEAYIYEDCYKLVEANKVLTTIPSVELSDETVTGFRFMSTTMVYLAVGICPFVVVLLVFSVLSRSKPIHQMLSKMFRLNETNDKQVRLNEMQEKTAPAILIEISGSEDDSEDQVPGKSSSERTNDNSGMSSQSQSLIAQGCDKNTLGVSEVKRRHSGGFRELE